MRVHIYKAGVWSLVRGVLIMKAIFGTFIIHFFHHLNVHKVLMGGQWFISKQHMVIIGAMNLEEETSQVQLYTRPFWIQIHTLSTRHMTEKVGKQLAKAIRKFLLHIPTQVLHMS